MEVFTGDCRMPTDVVLYPDNLTHFPNTPSDDHPPGIFTQYRPQPPPQKLRPIRCNGRNSTEFSDPTNGVLDCAMISCYGPQESVFLTQPSMEKLREEGKGGGGGAECSGGRGYLGSRALPENVGVTLQNTCSSMVGVECNLLLTQGQKFEAELSSSSDDGQEAPPEAIQDSSNRKRKRKTREKLESFVESMMSSMMHKQEQLHRQMIEIIEKKENERLMREEAWKQQELERANREREERAQETSRSLALISFIQKLMEHETGIPVPLEVQNLKDIKCDPSYNQVELGPSYNQVELKCGPSSNQEDLEHDPNNRRWPKSEVQALITVRAALSQKFNSKGPRNCVWDEVSIGMSDMGFRRSAKKCKEKWDNINKYYKRLVENGTTKRSDNSKVCTYFNELDLLYKSGFIQSETHDSSKKDLEKSGLE